MGVLLNKAEAVLYSFVSDFLFDIINTKPNKLEVILIVILISLIWIGSSEYIKKGLNSLKILKPNILLKQVWFNMVDVATYVSIFLIAKYILEFILSQISNVEFSLFESVVAIITVLLIVFTILNTIMALM